MTRLNYGESSKGDFFCASVDFLHERFRADSYGYLRQSKFVFCRNYFQELNATGIVDSLAQIVAFQQSTVIVCSVVF